MNIRKIAFALVANLAITSAAFAQDFELEGGSNTRDFYPESSGYMDCDIHITNKLSTNLILEYKKVSVDFPAAWDVSFCDNRNCYGVFIEQDTMFPIAAEQDAYIKITVFPNGVADTAVVKYAVWNRYNESSIDTLTYNIYVRWSAGRVSFLTGEASRLYPIPAREFLNIDMRGLEMASIYDAMGRVVMQLPAQNLAQINVSDWSAGTYTLRFQEGIKAQSQSFVIGQ
jgi:hypothetical protein